MSNDSYLTKAIQDFNNRLFENKKIDPKDTILIVGSPRSGTTWLMEILDTLLDYTYIFEPLNPIWFPESFKIGFRSRTYIPAGFDWPEGQDYLEKIFEGKLANLPVVDNPVSDLLQGFSIKSLLKQLFGNRLIVKSVNMNRMLPWITQRFRLRGTFCIVRHPCAVVASQLKTGLCGYRPSVPPYFDVFPTLENVLAEVSEIDYFDSNIVNRLKTIKTREEILAAVWCIDNYNILSKPKSKQWKLVIYEKLIKDGENELKNIFGSLGEKKIPRLALSRLKKPSLVTDKESRKYVAESNQQLSKWKKYLSGDQIDKILRIVSDFNIDIYSEDFEPKYENLEI